MHTGQAVVPLNMILRLVSKYSFRSLKKTKKKLDCASKCALVVMAPKAEIFSSAHPCTY